MDRKRGSKVAMDTKEGTRMRYELVVVVIGAYTVCQQISRRQEQRDVVREPKKQKRNFRFQFFILGKESTVYDKM
jgi:hypothetical protein